MNKQKKPAQKRIFKKIYIEITNTCNMSCKFCPKTKRKGAKMTLEAFEVILQKLQGFGKYLYFHVLGEPLSHPQIGDMLELAHAYGFMVNITTNGTLINKASDLIGNKSSLRQINFSLHSLEANTEFPLSMDEYISNILSYIDENQHGGVYMALRLWNLENPEFNTKNQWIIEKINNTFSLNLSPEAIISSPNGLKIGHNLYLNTQAVFEWPSLNNEFVSQTGFCHGLRNQIAILVDGTVVPCCLDGEGVINLGNILENSMHEILNSDRAQNFYNRFANNVAVEPLCQKCSYKSRFFMN